MAWWRRKAKAVPEKNESDWEFPDPDKQPAADESPFLESLLKEGFIIVDEDAARPANDPTLSRFWRDSHPEHRLFARTRLKREDLRYPPPGISTARRILYEILDTGLRSQAETVNIEPHSQRFRLRFHLREGWKTVMEGDIEQFNAICRELGVLVRDNPNALYETVYFELGTIEIDYQNGDWLGVVCKWIWGTDGPIVNIYFQASGEKGFVLELDNLGIREQELEKIKNAVDRPKGLILVCGPTGAGKSVLCYSALVRAQMQGRSVATLERPKKFVLPGAVQVGVEPGQTFRDGLDEALANDPEVLMFQDLWDHENLLPALLQADQRLVICGFHRFCAVYALPSLMQAVCHGLDKEKDHSEYLSPHDQIRPEALAQRLLLVTGSRLLPRLCPHCKRDQGFEPTFMSRVGIQPLEGRPLAHYFTTGCEACGQSGFAGMESVFEVLEVSPAIREMIREFWKRSQSQDDSESDPYAYERRLEARAVEEGMRPMFHVALDKVLEGRIRLKDVLLEVPKPYGTIEDRPESSEK